MRAFLLGCLFGLNAAACAQVSTIAVSTTPLRVGVERFGINLSGQTYYDSGQMLRNLVARNAGFEGETWQSILHCKQVSRNTCTDENQWTVWPADFLKGARFEVLSGVAAGETGSVLGSSGARAPRGVTLALSSLRGGLAAGDFVLVRAEKPGGADAGWWTSLHGGAVLGTELHDLSPHTAGKQALRVEAAGVGQSATVSSYFDTLAGRSFVQLRGMYWLRFRAKPLAGARQMGVKLERLDTVHGRESLLERVVALKPGWNDYALEVAAHEDGSAVGNVGLSFTLDGASALLDDVELAPAVSKDNPTAFRDAVVEALRELRPGVLRYMDNGASFGSSLDNLIAAPFARERAGSSTQGTVQEDVAIGLPEFLMLCEAVGAEPWITLPPGLSRDEAQRLVEYLAAPANVGYGAKRAAMGHAKPWSDVFARIHLELGNEQWNARSFAGATIADPTVYARRAAMVFNAARTSPSFRRETFDLVMGSWFAVPWWTQQEVAAAGGAEDSVAVAPYLFAEFNAAPNPEQTFGPMFAQPEQIDSRANGMMAQQKQALSAGSRPVGLNVYETNLGTMSGAVSQSAIDVTVPSVAAGLTVTDHMLLMLRDLGVTTQCLFALPEYRNDFAATNGAKETMPLWGTVVDMGGATNRRRPSFLALQMVNEAILPTMLAARVTGADPTWNQAASPNDHIALAGAHLLQTFAFADGARRSLIVLNLSRDASLPVNFSGANAPAGEVRQAVLSAGHITDSNEDRELVKIARTVEGHFDPAATRRLPPYSMTVWTWTQGR